MIVLPRLGIIIFTPTSAHLHLRVVKESPIEDFYQEGKKGGGQPVARLPRGLGGLSGKTSVLPAQPLLFRDGHSAPCNHRRF